MVDLALIDNIAYAKMKPRIRLAMVFLLSVVILGIGYILYTQPYVDENAKQLELTQAHAEEVTQAIENFHRVFGSTDRRKRPENYSQILTGQYLDQVLSDEFVETEEIIVTENVEVTGLRLLDYSPTFIRVIGCSTLQQSLFSTSGEHLKSFLPREVRWLYAFVLDDGVWKVAAQTYIGDTDLLAQNWENVSNWEQDLLGDLADFIDRPCFAIE